MPISPPYDYLILGSGRQGTAAAYDLIRFGQARRAILADFSLDQARAAADRINRLTGRGIAEAQFLDVSDERSVLEALGPVDCALSAVPYHYNLALTRAAIASGTCLCDLGGKTDIVMTQLALNEEALRAGISIVPDCGLGPGLINTMGALVIELLDSTQDVYLYDGGLPSSPIPPWNYELTFHINGLTNEMDGQAVFLRNGKIQRVDTLSEPEMIAIPPIGLLEADVTSGGTSTAPWTFEGKLRTYENKVLRYPGHYEWLRAYKTLGLFSEKPVLVDGRQVIPRAVYHALLEPQINTERPRDICVVRAIGVGVKDGKAAQVTVDLIDSFDEATGFTAMERLTGWHCAIMMAFQARREVRPGAKPVEIALPASKMMAEFKRRGIDYRIEWQ